MMENNEKDWNKFTVKQLRDELKKRGLLETGVKADLVERLKQHDQVEHELEGFNADSDAEDVMIDEEVEDDPDGDIAEAEEVHIDDDDDEEDGEEDIVDEQADDGEGQGEVEQMKEMKDETEVNAEEDALLDEEVEPKHDIKDVKDNKREIKKELNGQTDSIKITIKNDPVKTDIKTEVKTENEDTMDGTDKGVVIETVGEVDDDEFVAAVAGLEQCEFDDLEEEEKEKKKKKESKDDDDIPPLPSRPMFNWMVKQFNNSRDFSSLYIKPLTSKDVLCEAMHEWANRAIYFCINLDRNGKGVAILNFLTEKETKEAKEALTAALGEEVKIHHPSRHTENEMIRELSFKRHNSNEEERLIIVEDVPENVTEDQIGLLFPNAITVSHPPTTQRQYNWHDDTYVLPKNIERYFFVEFASPKLASEAVSKSKEYEIDGHKLSVSTLHSFDKAYKEMEKQKREEARQKRLAEIERKRQEKLAEIKKKVLEDTVRVEKCTQLEELEKRRATILKDLTLSFDERVVEKKKLTSEILELSKVIEQDTNYRKQVNMMKPPEPEEVMTRHTKQAFNIREKPKPRARSREKTSDRKDTKDSSNNRRPSSDRKDRKRSSSKTWSPIRTENKWKVLTTKRDLTDRDHKDIRVEIEKMEEDTRGWWHLLIHKPEDKDFPQNESDIRTFFSMYGKIMQVHLNDKRIFVRFNTHKAVAAAIRDLWGTKVKVEVPKIYDKYKKKLPEKDGRREKDVAPKSMPYQNMNMMEEQLIKQQQQMILQKQFEEQQKMLLQQQLSLLGNAPQSLLGLQTSVQSTLLAEPQGVPPLGMGNPSQLRGRDRDMGRSRSPEARQFEHERTDPKRRRMEEDAYYNRKEMELKGYSYGDGLDTMNQISTSSGRMFVSQPSQQLNPVNIKPAMATQVLMPSSQQSLQGRLGLQHPVASVAYTPALQAAYGSQHNALLASHIKQPLIKNPPMGGHQDRLNAFREGRI